VNVERKPTGSRVTYVYVVWMLCTGALAFVAVHQLAQAQRLRKSLDDVSASVEAESRQAVDLGSKLKACEHQAAFCDDRLAKCELDLVEP
jgi:hypothetical protein